MVSHITTIAVPVPVSRVKISRERGSLGLSGWPWAPVVSHLKCSEIRCLHVALHSIPTFFKWDNHLLMNKFLSYSNIQQSFIPNSRGKINNGPVEFHKCKKVLFYRPFFLFLVACFGIGLCTWKFCWGTYMCMWCMSLSTCVCMCWHVYLCVEARGKHWVSCSVTLCLIPLKQSLIVPGARLATSKPWWLSGLHTPTPTALLLQTRMIMPRFLVWVL